MDYIPPDFDAYLDRQDMTDFNQPLFPNVFLNACDSTLDDQLQQNVADDALGAYFKAGKVPYADHLPPFQPAPSTNVEQSAEGKQPAKSQPSTNWGPASPTTFLSCAFTTLKQLQERVTRNEHELFECNHLIRVIKFHLEGLRQSISSTNGTNSVVDASDAAPSTNHTTSNITSSTKPPGGRPPSNNTSSSMIDLSRDPRPGARARLAAEMDLPLECSRMGNDADRLGPSSSSLHPLTALRSSDASMNEKVRRRRRQSSSNRAAAIGDSECEARKIAPSRSSGPSDAIEGMIPGAGADRLLGLDRVGLPKGNVNGIAYSCEAACGYSDNASHMINCDSGLHRRQRPLKLLGGEKSGRGWYHRACGKVDKDPLSMDAPKSWICPSCVRKGTTSTDDQDYDDGADDDQDDNPGSADTEDSENDYDPGQDTPGEGGSDDDDDGDNDAKGDSDYNENKKLRDNGRNKKKSADKNHYRSAGDGADQDNNPDGNVGANEGDQWQQTSGGNGNGCSTNANGYSTNVNRISTNGDNEDATTNAPTKSRKGTQWSEEEKLLAMQFMRHVVQEGNIFGEYRFGEVGRRLQLRGYDRDLNAVKNVWNRGLRERSGYDERKNKKAPLTTSKQDAKTKKMREDRKNAQPQRPPTTKTQRSSTSKNGRSSTTETRRSANTETDGQAGARKKSVRPKRERESDDEDEIIPPKRQRSPPYDGDRFRGIP
jgi:hypothetical protein